MRSGDIRFDLARCMIASVGVFLATSGGRFAAANSEAGRPTPHTVTEQWQRNLHSIHGPKTQLA